MADESSWSVLDFVVFVVIAVVVILVVDGIPRWRLSWRFKNLPPGPFCWPVLGYVPFYDMDNNYASLMKEAKKYGGMFGLYIGTRYAVVIDDFEILKIAYSKDEFLDRPTSAFQTNPDPRQFSVMTSNGASWRDQKRFIMNSFRFLGTGTEDFRSIIMAQMLDVVTSLRNEVNQDVDIDRRLELALNNVTFHILFGKRFDHDHPLIRFLGEYDKYCLTFFELNGMRTFLPWLGFIMARVPKYKKAIRVLEKMNDFIRSEISEHKGSREVNEPRDFVDLFMNQMDKPGEQDVYKMASLHGNIQILLISSSETTRNTLVWFVLYMAEYPEIQTKVQKEIDSVIGREREPVLADKLKMPFLDATIMETMRARNIININPPRMATTDTTLCGYDIPKDTVIIHNMTSHFKNPKYWKNPDEFNPARFLTNDGTKAIAPETFIPFSYGKRSCPGEKIASQTVFLFAITLLQKFRFYPPTGGVNLKIKTNFSNSYVHPFVRLQNRD